MLRLVPTDDVETGWQICEVNPTEAQMRNSRRPTLCAHCCSVSSVLDVSVNSGAVSHGSRRVEIKCLVACLCWRTAFALVSIGGKLQITAAGSSVQNSAAVKRRHFFHTIRVGKTFYLLLFSKEKRRKMMMQQLKSATNKYFCRWLACWIFY